MTNQGETDANKTNKEETDANNGEQTNGTMKIVRVAVGSKNPVKVKAVKQALESVLKTSTVQVQLEVQGFDVPSDVPNQPFGDVSDMSLFCFFFREDSARIE